LGLLVFIGISDAFLDIDFFGFQPFWLLGFGLSFGFHGYLFQFILFKKREVD